ncbi:MAG: VCBS repeat-containing protein [Planctomycetota bacterium]
MGKRLFLGLALCGLVFTTGCWVPLYLVYEQFLAPEPATNDKKTNAPPVVVIGAMARQYNASIISIPFTLTDTEQTLCEIEVYYSTDSGTTWELSGNITGTTTGLASAGTAHTVAWNAVPDLGTSATTLGVQVSIVAADGRNASLRAASNAFIAGNDIPQVTITQPAAIEAGNVIIRYTVIDPAADAVDLTCQYSTNGTNYSDMTIAAGEVTGLTTSDTGEAHNVVWGSNTDIAGINAGTVWVKLTATDGAPAGGSDTTDSAFQVLNNASTPIAIITAFDRSFSADVELEYKLVDTDGGTATITTQYSENGTDWYVATEKIGAPSEGRTGLGMSASGDLHTFVWDSVTDIGAGLKTGVYFRIQPDDGGGPGVAGDVGPFSIGNSIPVVDIMDPTGTKSGNIVITYSLTDLTSDFCEVRFQYGESPTGPWTNANMAVGANPELNVSSSPGGAAHAFIWNSDANYTNASATVYIRVEATDGGGSGAHVSAAFLVDNTTSNSAPVVSIGTIGRQYNASVIPISFTLYDAENQDCDITLEYQVAGGGWSPCTGIAGATTGLTALSTGSAHSVTWNGTANLTPATRLQVQVRIIANDTVEDSLPAESNGFTSGNNAPTLTAAPPVNAHPGGIFDGPQTGTVVVNYALSDPAADACSILAQYQVDGEGTWNTCTSASVNPNPQAGVNSSSGGIVYSFALNSKADLGTTRKTVWIRFSATDGAGAVGQCTTTMTIDVKNNNAPSVTFLSSQMVLNDGYAVIPVPYSIQDPENDICSITLEYSTDNVTWQTCTEYPEKASEGMSGLSSFVNAGNEAQGEHLFLWNSIADIGRQDAFSALRIKALDASGNESGYVQRSLLSTNYSKCMEFPAQTLTAGSLPHSVTMGDINGDGYADIACANGSSGTVTVSYGSAAGHGSPQAITAGSGPCSVTMGDINGDGYADIACANNGSGTVTVSYGSAAGHGSPQTITAGSNPCSVTMGDINGDGYADIACANSGSGTVTVSYGIASGHGSPQTITAGSNPYSVTMGDINGDGYADIACANQWSDTVTVSYGSAAGHGSPQTITAGSSPCSVIMGDINGDGYADIACANQGSGTVTVSYGSAAGHGSPQAITAGSGPCSVTMGDINGDGYADIACANQGSDTVTVSYGSVAGHGSPQTITAGSQPWSVTMGDINGDGYADIACANYNSGTVTVSYGSAAGHGSPQTITAGSNPYSVTMGDINGDGYADIACANKSSGTVTVSYGSASGHGAPQTITAGGMPYSVTMGDINGDGYADIACANHGSGTVTVSYGETSCQGQKRSVDTTMSNYPLRYNSVQIDFPQGSFSSIQEATLWLSSTSIRIPHPAIGIITQNPIKASFPWDLMRFDIVLEVGKSAEMTLPFMPNISDERIKWADFRLYHYGWGVKRFDPRDDVVEIVATTENGTLMIDPVSRTATTTGAGNITKFGKYQLFQVQIS